MRADLSTIQQTLTPEAAAALARAIDEAARKRHGQTTPLHVAAALLAAPAGLLRQACARAAAASGGGPGAGPGAHPMPCRALELCFSVALDRLPAAAAAGQGAAPPVSNALVAALKRAQAQQRRGCPEAAQQPLLAVKVELEQLVLSILDDPSVSRVMREAKFSSAAVKSTIEQSLFSASPASSASAISTPKALPAATALSPSPSPLGRAGNANAYLNPRLATAAAASGGGGGDDARKVLDVMLKPARRNPVLVGDTGPDAVLKEAIRKIPTAGSPALSGAKVLSLEAELAKLAGDKAAMAAIIVELSTVVEKLLVEHSGVVLDLGDLKWLVEGAATAASEGSNAVVAEMARLLRRFGTGKVWSVATAACATYLRCKVYHPAMEAEWDLQAVPIARGAGAALSCRPGGTGMLGSSLGMLSPTIRPMPVIPTALRWPPGAGSAQPSISKPAMCQLCKGSYEHELAKLAAERADKQAARPEAARPGLPHWMKPSCDQLQTREQEWKWKEAAEELEKKWRETCGRTHGTRAGVPALSMPLAALGPRPPSEPKLALTKAPPTLKMSTSWEKTEDTPTSERRKSPPGSPVKTDLMLGRLDPGINASMEKEQKENYDGLTAMQKAKIAGISDIESFKRLLKGLTEKVSWQSDAASAIAAVVIQCRSGSGKRRNVGARGDMWLLFIGPDQAGKRKMVNALSELMVNSQPVVVNFGGDSWFGKAGNDGMKTGVWGKTALDRVSEAVRQNPFSVIVLEGIDQVDVVVCGKIKRAMETGRLPDSRGREVSLGNVIFVLTTNWLPEELKGQKFETLLQGEGRMLELASSNWQLELSVGDKQVKHRADWLCDGVRPAKVPKELSGGHGLSLDLNLSVGALDDTEGSRNSSDLSVEQEQDKRHLAVKCSTPAPDYDLLNLVDDAIVFRPVDFAPFRKTVTDCISSKFDSIIGNSSSLRIDEDAIDRMAGTVWLTDEKLEDWADKVLMRSIERLWSNTRCHNDRAIVRLATAADKSLPRWGGGREGLPATVPIAIDGM